MFRISRMASCQYGTAGLLLLSLLFVFSSIFPGRVQAAAAAGWISQSNSNSNTNNNNNNLARVDSSFERRLSDAARSRLSRLQFLNQRQRHFAAKRSDIIIGDAEVVGPRLIPNNDNNNNQKKKDLLVIAWEGCLCDTLEWRIETGLKAAFDVWPELEIMLLTSMEQQESSSSSSSSSTDLKWLYNKLGALQHVLTPPPKDKGYYYSPAVEYGLAIRMLLEEQELDQGRSNGSKGKYGSRFHPSAQDKAFASSSSSSSSSSSNTSPPTTAPATSRSDNFNAQRRGQRQQRPLTVGEIAANWQETLREAVMIRYYMEDKENPLDQLHDAIVRIQRQSSETTAADNDDEEEEANSDVVMNKLKLLPDMAAMLQDRFASLTLTSSCSSSSSSPSSYSSCDVIVMVHHEMDLPIAKRSIENALLSSSSSSSSFALPIIRTCSSLSQLLSGEDNMQNNNEPSIWIMCTSNVASSASSSSSASSTTTTTTMTSIMAAFPEDTTVHIVESCWPQLEAYIPLLGDCIPRPGSNNIGECMLIGECEKSDHDTGRRFLQLCLGQWASHPDSQSTAIMNVWTTVMSLTDCQELVTARILTTAQQQQQG